MKQKINIHLFMENQMNFDTWKTSWVPVPWCYRVDDNENRIFVNEQTVEIEVPENFDPTAKQVAALEKLRDEVRKKFTDEIAAITERINKLQALEYTK